MVSKFGFAFQGCILDLHNAVSVLLNSMLNVTAKEMHIAWLYDSSQGEV